MSLKRIDLLICCGSGCVSAGAIKIKDQFHSVLKDKGLTNEINIIETGCMGPCDYGPVTVSYTHLRAHETVLDLVCRLLLEKKKKKHNEI